ncbi:hypothetical protein HDU84_007290 [Entophlyctis sp. JEL0112]|nr:hypothetical protein HDU84_007290 [Entophlyctis sp. JEL0112]
MLSDDMEAAEALMGTYSVRGMSSEEGSGGSAGEAAVAAGILLFSLRSAMHMAATQNSTIAVTETAMADSPMSEMGAMAGSVAWEKKDSVGCAGFDFLPAPSNQNHPMPSASPSGAFPDLQPPLGPSSLFAPSASSASASASASSAGVVLSLAAGTSASDESASDTSASDTSAAVSSSTLLRASTVTSIARSSSASTTASTTTPKTSVSSITLVQDSSSTLSNSSIAVIAVGTTLGIAILSVVVYLICLRSYLAVKRRRSALTESESLFSADLEQQHTPTHKGRSYAFKGMAQMYEHGIQRLRTATVRTFSRHKNAMTELETAELFGAPKNLHVSNLLEAVRSACAAGEKWGYGEPLSAEDEANILSLVGELVAAHPNSDEEHSNIELLQPSATGPAAQLSDGLRYFDPACNVIIPTLSPITTLIDQQAQTTQIHMRHTVSLLSDTVSPQLRTLVGPLGRIPLDDPTAMPVSTAPPSTLLVSTPSRRRLRTRVTDAALDNAAARARFLVRCAHTPPPAASDGELILRVGDVVAVEHVGSDAWADGCNYTLARERGLREGLRGRFPLFVVEVGESLIASADRAGYGTAFGV